MKRPHLVTFALVATSWIAVEVGYRIAVGVGPFGELTGFDLFLIPLHAVGIAIAICLGLWLDRRKS